MRRRWRAALLVILLPGVWLSTANAQSDRASIVGVIKDTSGAVVPGAKVKITNVGTGQTFEAESGADGRYVTPLIFRPGSYNVGASKEGFKTAVSQNVILNIGDVKDVSFTLEVGAVAETVTVTEAAPLLEAETSSRGEVITGRQIVELPLKDRNFTQLATLTPGVSRSLVSVLTDSTFFNQGDKRFGLGDVPGASNEQGSTEASRFSRSGGAAISVNGLRPTTNNFSLDGVDNNEPQFGTIGVFPNPDAIAEFKVETSVAKAEVGRGGATINTTYQSGTNDFHGSVYYYGQNDALNATHSVIGELRDREVQGGKTPAQAEADLPKSRLRVNEFGFTFGGPIKKNKTFFFGDFLGQRNATPNPFSTGVPTAKSRAGDFSEFDRAVLDPQTCRTPGDISSGGCRQFAGNIIPNLQSRTDLSRAASALLALYPLPTINVRNPNNSGNANFFGVRNNTENINSFDIKLDHRFSDKNSIMGRFTKDNQQRVRANFFPKVPTAGFGAGDEVGNTRQLVVSDTHTFKPTVLNEARFGWTRVEIGIFNCGVEGHCGIPATICSDLGIPNCNHGTPASSGGILTGGFGTGEFEFTGDGGLFLVKSNNFYVADSLTVIHGKHTLKAGIEARPRFLDTIDGGRAGGLKGHLQYGPDGGNQSTGNVQADYLLARPAIFAAAGSILGGDNPFELRTTEWAFFIQDDWKVAPNLILNLGMRYDLFPGFSEANGRMANWDVVNRTIVRAKDSGDRLVDTPLSNWGPRIGFAYNFGRQKKVVLRGGYGIFYVQDGVDRPPLVNNPPLTRSVGFNGGGFFGGTSAFNLNSGPPTSTPVDPPVIETGSNLFVVPTSHSTGMAQEFNLTVQWEFARNWLLDVGYVGTRTRHLLATRQLGNSGNGLGLARTPTGATTTTNPSPNQPIGNVIAYENRASANYDAFQTRLERRFSRGLEMRANYTWSHNIDDSTGVFTGLGESRGNSGGPVNPFNFGADRSNSSLDRRHLFTANVIWDLPIGPGHTFGSSASGFWGKLISGWQSNYIFSGQTGQPFGIVADSSVGRTRADQICADPFSGAVPTRFLNVACFVSPRTTVRNLAGGSVPVGNTSRNPFTGPSFFRTDFSLFKNTTIRERYKVQFGVEFFNIFNHVNHIVPNTFIDNNNSACQATNSSFSPGRNCPFGRFDNALTPRQIQYRVKFFF